MSTNLPWILSDVPARQPIWCLECIKHTRQCLRAEECRAAARLLDPVIVGSHKEFRYAKVTQLDDLAIF